MHLNSYTLQCVYKSVMIYIALSRNIIHSTHKDYLLECLARFLAGSLHSKLCAEYVAELGTVAVPASGHLLLLIVVVGGGEECPEYQLWDIHLLHCMHLYRDTPPSIPYTDQVLLPAAEHIMIM